MKNINASMIRSAAVTAILAASALTTKAVSLLDLTSSPNASLIVGNLRFFNFSNVNQTGNLSVSLDRIFVTPSFGGPGASVAEAGIRFSSPDWSLSGPGLFYDMSIDFHVETVTGEALLTDNTLELAGSVSGSGMAMVGETVLDANNGSTLANKFVFMDSTISVLEDHKVFPAGPYSHLEISKDFFMSTGRGDNSAVAVSHFDQSFSQVPEGGPGLAVISGALGVLCWAGRKRGSRRATTVSLSA